MNMLPEDVKERVIFIYFQYCKFNFIVKYLEWRSKKLLFYGKEVAPDFFYEIEKLREMC